MVQRKDLFEGTRPAKLGLDGETEMPILYYKDACAYFYFTADAEAVQKRLPSDNLHVVKVSPTRCMVALATYNYIHASVGSYGETVMVAICTHDKVPKGPLPLIRQARDAHFGTFVFRCPVTTQWAMDGGRIMWNYPKFISDMTFTSNGRYFECRLSPEGKRIFDLRAPKRGRLSRDTKPQRCFLAQGDKLVQAPIPAYGICETAVLPRDAAVTVYPVHPMSDDWLAIKPSKRPLMVQHFNGHMAALGAASVIEEGIRPYDGHRFVNDGRDGEHHVIYGGVEYKMHTVHQKEITLTRV